MNAVMSWNVKLQKSSLQIVLTSCPGGATEEIIRGFGEYGASLLFSAFFTLWSLL